MIIKPTGTIDFFPKDTQKLQYIEDTAKRVAAKFGFGEIRFPTFEFTELFARGVGSTTDVVQKEMYTFTDRDGESITLRPEGTAGVARAIVENGVYGDAMPLKYYYIANFFRHEKKQKGRYREFSQFGVEMYGSTSAVADASVIALGDTIIKELKVPSVELKINSIGCKCCRPNFHKALKEYFGDKKDQLCETCKSRLDTNPMRILDCKSEICSKIAEGAPKTLDYLCPDCADHFDMLKNSLEAMGIEYSVDTRIVRGLDYYSRSVFEFVCSDSTMGSQSTICGGGRYDGLMDEISAGEVQLPACGFGMGITRMLPAVPMPEFDNGPVLYIASMGKSAQIYAGKVASALRNAGIYAEYDLVGRSLKAQMKYANKIIAKNVLIIGDNEIETGKAQLRNMQGGEQVEIALDQVVDHFAK